MTFPVGIAHNYQNFLATHYSLYSYVMVDQVDHMANYTFHPVSGLDSIDFFVNLTSLFLLVQDIQLDLEVMKVQVIPIYHIPYH